MLSVGDDFRLSKHFWLKEFQCKDGTEYVNVDYRLIKELEKLRIALGKPISITSGYRTGKYNESVGGVRNSMHLTGKAADIQVQGYTPEQVYQVAQQLKFAGIGIYETFIHLDVREGKRVIWRG